MQCRGVRATAHLKIDDLLQLTVLLHVTCHRCCPTGCAPARGLMRLHGLCVAYVPPTPELTHCALFFLVVRFGHPRHAGTRADQTLQMALRALYSSEWRFHAHVNREPTPRPWRFRPANQIQTAQTDTSCRKCTRQTDEATDEEWKGMQAATQIGGNTDRRQHGSAAVDRRWRSGKCWR